MSTVDLFNGNPNEAIFMSVVGIVAGAYIQNKYHVVDKVIDFVSDLPVIKELRVGLCMAACDPDEFNRWERLSNNKSPEGDIAKAISEIVNNRTGAA